MATDIENKSAASGLPSAAGSRTVEVSLGWLRHIRDTMDRARRDIYQTRRTNQYNLTGVDPSCPDDKTEPPNPPLLIRQDSLDESEAVEGDLREACQMVREIFNSANKKEAH